MSKSTIEKSTGLISRHDHSIGRIVTTLHAWGFHQFEIIGRDRIVYGRANKWDVIADIAELIPGLMTQIDPDGQMVTMYKCRRDQAKLSADLRKRAIVRQQIEDREAGLDHCPALMKKLGDAYAQAYADYRKWSGRVVDQETADSIALASLMAQAAMWSSVARVL